MKTLKTLVAAGIATLFLATQADAVVLIGNYPIANNTSLSAGLSNLRHKAMGFTTPQDVYALKAVTLHLNSTSAGSVPLVEIWDSVAGGPLGFQPGTLQHQLITPAMGLGMTDYVFMANGSFNFAPSTLYFLRVSGPAGVPTFDWRASLNAAQTPVGLATHFSASGGLFTTNSGSTWTASASFNFYEIEANLVPEPATFAIIGVGLAGLCLVRRRR